MQPTAATGTGACYTGTCPAPPRRTWMVAMLLAAVLPGVAAARTGIPAAYGPMVQAPAPQPAAQGGSVLEFDLDPALARAQRERKRLYVYLGADDCPYCRRYEAFLEAHARELAPQFASRQYLVVDLRSSLSVQARQLRFKAHGRSLPYAEFLASFGDERARLLVYPSVWLFDAQLRPLMQMPAGTGTFQTVPEQLEILDLVQ